MNVSSRTEILLLTNEPVIERAVTSAINAEPRLDLVGNCRDTGELGSRLERDSIQIAVVDIDPRPEKILGDLERLVNRFTSTRFIALAAELNAELALRAMQAGVRHVQVKAGISTQLAEALCRLIPPAQEQGGQAGTALTVLSSSGGCGATTLVVNLANELQLTSFKPVLVVDLDHSYGAVATYLELQGEYGVADVLAHERTIDAELIRTTASKQSERLHALLSPASTGFTNARPIQAEYLDLALTACKRAYTFTLVDAPRVSMDVASVLARGSETVLIVLQPSIKDVRVTRAMLDALFERGVARERIHPVVNRVRTRYQMISLQEIQKALKVDVIGCLSNDFTSAIRGINYGKPLAELAPKSKLRREMAHMAVEFSALSAGNNGKAKSYVSADY